MEKKRFKPLVDGLWLSISLFTALIMAVVTVMGFAHITVLLWVVPVDLFVLYFLVSPLVGYVELRDESVFIRFGFFLTREIAYARIRGASKERKFYSDSMLSLKCAYEHINIRYNSFDLVTVSVTQNDELMSELSARISR